jgi:hypothetical protein
VSPERGTRVLDLRTSEAMLRTVDQVLLGEADFHLGDECVVVASLPLRVRGVTNFLKLHRLGESGAWD